MKTSQALTRDKEAPIVTLFCWHRCQMCNTNSNELIMNFFFFFNFSIPNNSIMLKNWEPWQAIKFKSSLEFIVHPAFFIHITCYYYTYTTYFGKEKVTLSRVVGIITRKFSTQKFGFKVLGDNIKVFYKQGWHYRG